MKTELAFQNEQNRIEASALFPKEPRTSEVILIGEDAAEMQAAARVDDYETQVLEGVVAQTHELEAWLKMKVRNELIGQIVHPSEAGINISNVAAIVQAEMLAEEASHYENSHRLQNVEIPLAQMREAPVTTSAYPFNYWQKDVDNLYVRVGVSDQMVENFDTVKTSGEDWAYDLAEELIDILHDEAKDEAIAILRQQKEDLEREKREADARSAELEARIHLLERDLDDSKREIDDRDIALFDREMTDHLTEEAKELAQ